VVVNIGRSFEMQLSTEYFSLCGTCAFYDLGLMVRLVWDGSRASGGIMESFQMEPLTKVVFRGSCVAFECLVFGACGTPLNCLGEGL
jgi:hypothetical protein